MSTPVAESLSISPTEKTYSSFNEEQGKAYLQGRRDYTSNVYKHVVDSHASGGGRFDTVVDVGCGPGFATKRLAEYFQHAIGLDPSEGMIAIARSLGGSSLDGQPIRFEISTAEVLGRNLSPPIADGSVDVIVAANAAHWFDMSRFWASAARLLRPGGTVALWAVGKPDIHTSTPNAAAIQAAIEEHKYVALKAYSVSGSQIVKNHYANLVLPWDCQNLLQDFDRSTFARRDWGIDEPFLEGELEIDLDTLEKMIATGSAETRYRQAHPDDIGTERDIVRKLRMKIEELLRDAGVEAGSEKIKGAVRGTMLIVKKL